MKLTVTQEAAKKYKEEMDLQEGDVIRFYVKLYGESSVHPNFSLGVCRESSEAPQQAPNTNVQGILFYLDNEDGWYLKNYHLTVDLQRDDITFIMDSLSQ